MLIKTRGIVFRFTKYGDTSVIVTAFTEFAGLQSFILKGIRKNKSGMALYQPLTLLDLVIYHKESAGLQHIREARCRHIYSRIHGDVFRETVAFFITELLNRSIREQSHPEDLYGFMEDWLLRLDNENTRLKDFHLYFMANLCRHLGFGAQQPDEMISGKILPEELFLHLKKILYGEETDMNYTQRKDILELFTSFYREHIEGFGTLKSVEVLQEILAQTIH